MANLVRSLKFVRFFTGWARNLTLNSVRNGGNNVLLQQRLYSNNVLSRNLATHQAPATTQSNALEQSLQRLDEDARRSGRISLSELEDILEEIRQTGSATSSQSLLMIRCCGNLVPEEHPEIRTGLVQQIWNTLEKLGIPMDVSHYNALLRVYLENEHKFSPMEFLSELERKGVEPNRVTYQRLISRYCQEGNIKGATGILELMKEKQLPINENVFNALVMGHSRSNDMESAHGILGLMQQTGIEPSAETYTQLLCGYASKGDFDAICKIMDECEKKDIHFLDRDYMDIIYALSVNNHTDFVDQIIGRMRQRAGYNQDAVNLILRLINIGQEDVAMKVLHTMPRPLRADGQLAPVGSFLIKQLVKAKRPVEKVLAICRELQQEDLNPRALLIAVESSLMLGLTEQSLALLSILQEDGFPLRQHYFWPVLASYGKLRDDSGVLNVIQRMINSELIPSGETLRDYVVPNISGPFNEIISKLRSVGVSPGATVDALVCHYLQQDNMKAAAQVALFHKAHYNIAVLRRNLVGAFTRTSDVQSFVTILAQIHNGTTIAESLDEEEAPGYADQRELVGQFVLDSAAAVRREKVAVIQPVLEELLIQGLGLTNTSAELLQERLGEELTDNISNLLSKLTSRDLMPVRQRVRRPPLEPWSVQDAQPLEHKVRALEAEGQPTGNLKKQLLLLYCKGKEIEKAESILKDLEKDNEVSLASGTYAMLIELYTHYEKLEDALQWHKKLVEKEQDFCLDDSKTIRLVTLMVKNNQVDESLDLLSQQSRERKLEEKSFGYNALCWRLLNTLAEEGKVEEVKQMFDALLKYQYVTVSNVLLGPLIKAYLSRDDLQGALSQFENCCREYRATPWKNELTCRLIQAEDADALQHLTDLSTQVHGEVNSLYDLVFAFVECGRIRQARKILETPGLQSRSQRMANACHRYMEEGMIEPLEGLVEATRDLNHIDRSELFFHLMKSYCNAGDKENALGLWTKMQEENVQPTDEFLFTLGTFLKGQGCVVPFVIPEPAPTQAAPARSSAPPREEIARPTITQAQELRLAVQAEDFDKALAIKERLESQGRSVGVMDTSAIVEGLVKSERLREACKLVEKMISQETYPVARVFRFLLSKLVLQGDVETLTHLGSFISPFSKKTVSFDNRLCNAYQTAGRTEEYVDILDREITNAKEEDIPALGEKFPRGGSLGILKEFPELNSKFEVMAEKYASKGILAPINVLWIHHFSAGDDEKADKIWNTYLVNAPRVMFQGVSQAARMNQDEELARKLLRHLKSISLPSGAIGIAHSCLLDILVSKNKLDEAMSVLETALKETSLEYLNRTALRRLQTALQAEGKPFPYTIPQRGARPDYSSSDSDEK